MSLSPGYFKKGMTMRAVWTLFLTAVLWISAPLQAAENVTYYHNDALGSPVAATDADGNLLWREIYEPFGRRFEQDPSSDGNSRWYTGHQETDYGLVYMGARHYDPFLGRFLSVDPVRFVEGNQYSFNRYAYVNNNPYSYVDPDGRYWQAVVLTGIGYCAKTAPCRNAAVKGAQAGINYVRSQYSRTVMDTPESPEDSIYLDEEADSTDEIASNGSENETPSPALKGDPYNPQEVDKRRSDRRRDMGAPSNDPDSPIPDQNPGSDQGGHESRGRTPHDSGERNVNRHEEHSRRPKGGFR